MTGESKFNEWAMVELMGHQMIVGRVSESAIAGAPFLRVDVPQFGEEQAFTRFFSAGAVYSINPVTEEVARGLLSRGGCRNEPVSKWQMPQLAEKVAGEGDEEGYDED